MNGIRTMTPFCPRCQTKHVAGVEGDGDPWFTCGRVRFRVPPDEQTTLGTEAWTRTVRLDRPLEAGCLGCGALAATSGDGDDGLRRFICYRCGTVGAYRRETRDDWDPDRETWLFAEAADEIAQTRLDARDRDVDLFAPPETVADKITAALDVARGTGLPLVIEPDDPIHDTVRHPEDVEGDGIGSKVKRAYERFYRWMSGLD